MEAMLLVVSCGGLYFGVILDLKDNCLDLRGYAILSAPPGNLYMENGNIPL